MPPSFMPQPYPLWAYRDGNVGRVIGWYDTEEDGLVPVVWEDDIPGPKQWPSDGGRPVFLYDTEAEATEEVRADLHETYRQAAERRAKKAT